MYSCGSPIRRPRTSPVSASVNGGTGASSDVQEVDLDVDGHVS